MASVREKSERRMRRLTTPFANWRRELRPDFALPRGRRVQLFGIAAVLLVVLVVWGLFDLTASRNDLLAVRSDLAAAAGNLGTATDTNAATELRTTTRDAVARTGKARHRLERTPLLRVLDFVPVVRQQRRDLLRAVAVANEAAVAGDDLAGRVETVRDGLTVRNAKVDLDAMNTLADAAAQTGAALDALPRTRRGGQWGSLAKATTQLDAVITDAANRLTTAADTLRVARRLLGSEGRTRILIGLQNNAEMRDQGMVLSYVVVEANNGAVEVTRSGDINDLSLSAPVRDVTLPTGTAESFSYLNPLQVWQSVNATADTAIAGRSMASMYRAKTGQRVDGVVALDVLALASLLRVTGPVAVAGIEQPVTSNNAASLLLNEQYATSRNPNDRQKRHEELARVTTAVIDRIRGASLETSSLIRALGESAGGGHAWVTAVDDDDQEALERAGLGGRPGRVAPERTIHVSVQNGTATKLDWFVKPTVDVEVELTEDGTALVTTTVTLNNTAPVPTPASEQFGPDNVFTTVAGLYRGRVHFWGPQGGDQVGSVEESGLRLNITPTDVAAGQESSVSFTTILVGAVTDETLHLRFVPQPRAHPVALRVSVAGEGWKVTPKETATHSWDRTLDLTWRLRR